MKRLPHCTGHALTCIHFVFKHASFSDLKMVRFMVSREWCNLKQISIWRLRKTDKNLDNWFWSFGVIQRIVSGKLMVVKFTSNLFQNWPHTGLLSFITMVTLHHGYALNLYQLMPIVFCILKSWFIYWCYSSAASHLVWGEVIAATSKHEQSESSFSYFHVFLRWVKF